MDLPMPRSQVGQRRAFGKPSSQEHAVCEEAQGRVLPHHSLLHNKSSLWFRLLPSEPQAFKDLTSPAAQHG